MWPLSQAWYGDRLEQDYSPKPVAELQTILTRAGLVSQFWQLR
jgi:hypothetical protein